ncbi:MAG: glycerate kinase [Propionibacteriaceae bacterium]|jgi:glycerate kinase|nr:glycerate kinase [Propionibacteriaceae bacterium]
MRIICAPDSFKESMSALEAAEAMAAGIHEVNPTADCRLVPMADGGEGTTGSIIDALGGEMIELPAMDALGRLVTAHYGWVADRRLAVIETAQAIGLERIAPADRDVELASSYGAGQMIADALARGAGHLIIGLGGSATNDGGAGLISALGARFLDSSGAPIGPGGAALIDLASVDLSGVDPLLAACRIELACDVDNPLLGPIGASAVFGPQKGASPEQVARLDAALAHYADVMEAACGVAFRDIPGAGAAGGMGTPLMALAHPEVRPGVQIVIETVGLAEQVAGADWVFTGEGSIDFQTLHGKTLMGVLGVAREAGVPVIMFGGQITEAARPLLDQGVTACMPIVGRVSDLATALAQGPANLQAASAVVMRLLQASTTL